MIVSQLGFVIAWSLIKKVGVKIPLFEVIFFRGLISLPLLFLLAKSSGHLRLKINSPIPLLLRCIFGISAMICYFYSLTKLAIGDAATLTNTAPIFIAILSPLMLKESVSKKQFWFIAIAFGAVILILKPGWGVIQVGAIFAVASGLFAALSQIQIRKLKNRDNPFTITIYFTIFVILVSVVPAMGKFVMPSLKEWIFFGIIGLATTLSQLMMTKAYHLADASFIAPFGYTSVIFSYCAGIILWMEVPDVVSIVAALIIISCGVAIMLTSRGRVPGPTPVVRT
ncbi:MAG: DMT family transporter [Pseudomonadota bacterium]